MPESGIATLTSVAGLDVTLSEGVLSVTIDRPDKPGSTLRLRAQMRSPGRAWLEITVTPHGGGSTYMQRAIFGPRGIVGQLYWLVVWPLRTAALGALARDVVASAR